jgi:two-component sensor histidine kinase
VIEVSWRIDGSRPSGSFHMSWTERNGTKIPKPERRGFGTTVITKMVELSVGGRTEVEFAKSGLVWTMSCPIEGVSEPETNGTLMGAIG